MSTHEQRMRWTAENPVASAKAFHLIVDALVSTFLNIPCSKSRHFPQVDWKRRRGGGGGKKKKITKNLGPQKHYKN